MLELLIGKADPRQRKAVDGVHGLDRLNAKIELEAVQAEVKRLKEELDGEAGGEAKD